MYRRLFVIALGAFLGFLALSTPALAESKTVTLSVPSMDCEVCPITVKKALQKVAGVEKVSASLEAKRAVVTFDDSKASVDKLREATAKAGYPSTVK